MFCHFSCILTRGVIACFEDVLVSRAELYLRTELLVENVSLSSFHIGTFSDSLGYLRLTLQQGWDADNTRLKRLMPFPHSDPTDRHKGLNRGGKSTVQKRWHQKFTKLSARFPLLRLRRQFEWENENRIKRANAFRPLPSATTSRPPMRQLERENCQAL